MKLLETNLSENSKVAITQLEIACELEFNQNFSVNRDIKHLEKLLLFAGHQQGEITHILSLFYRRLTDRDRRLMTMLGINLGCVQAANEG